MTSSRLDRIRFLVESELTIPSPDRSLNEEKFSRSDREEVEKIVRAQLKDKKTEEQFVRIVRNVLTQLYKTLYNRRSMWGSALNANSD